ncbi:hypothetical protein BBJ28_00022689 [Nothophytophthora sp. Chile5]|nr:hypothetical protein BBJ28_00022689 [Nothophytophthora sp. Chile5]
MHLLVSVGRVKYGISAYYHFLSCFQAMPIAALLQTPQGNVFCVHGGISPELPSLEAIQAIDRRREIPTEGPLCDLLWADPATEEPQAEETVETQATWLANQVSTTNCLLSVVRAHECEDEGYMFHFNSEGFEKLDKREDKAMPPLITVFSAPNYCDSYGNVVRLHIRHAGYLVLRKEPFSWEVQQVKAVGHPVPPIASAERGSDMWRQFNQTLPFLPASKEFFEEILWLSEKQRGLKGTVDASKPSIAHAGARDMSAVVEAEVEDPTERRRRMTSEMHPQAIRRVLDEEVHKWVQVEEEHGQTAAHEAAPRIQRRPSLPKVEEAQIDDRSDLDMMKLMFSLMDTDGSMTLSSAKVSQFIFNILGSISAEAAEKYLAALDFDQNGVVDFADILSWAAVMKANHDSCDAGGVLSWSGLRTGLRFLMREIDFRKVCLWLALGCLLRDLFVPKQRRVIKSSSVRLLGSISLALYTMDLLSGGDAGRGQLWARFSPLKHAIAIISRRFTTK